MQLVELPNELLDAILRAAVDESTTREIGTLRLTCKRFAKQHFLLSHLFRHVQLVADIKDVASLTAEALARSGLAPFVQHVTFVPPLRYPMKLNHFKHILRDQAYHRYGCYSPTAIPRRHNESTAYQRSAKALSV